MKTQIRFLTTFLVVVFITVVLSLAGVALYADGSVASALQFVSSEPVAGLISAGFSGGNTGGISMKGLAYRLFATTTITPQATMTDTATTLVLITSTPRPENIVTVAAIAPTLTAAATTTGTPTPLPPNWVTPLAVTSSPTPENQAAADYIKAEATAIALLTGTFTPTPENMVTATSTATPTPRPTRTPTATPTATPILIMLEGELPPMTPTKTPTPVQPIPAVLTGKIAFKSNRTGKEQIYIINPDGTGLALLTNKWPYEMAKEADAYSPDGRFRVFTKDAIRYNQSGRRSDGPDLYWYDAHYNVEQQLTFLGQGVAYNGVWSPTREQVAFVSNESSDDEIWVVNRDGSGLKRLTETNEAYNAREIGKDSFIPEVNGHPSWSPDGNQIVFWSNRSGRRQIWIMDAGGNNLYTLSQNGYDDWDPVWIKYPGVATYAAP